MWEEMLCEESVGKASLDLPHTVEEFNIFTLSPLVTSNVQHRTTKLHYSIVFHCHIEYPVCLGTLD